MSTREGSPMRFPVYWAVVAPSALLATWYADKAVGHGTLLWALTATSLVLLRSITMGRMSWFHAFMALFFVLGCWLKVVVHHVVDYPYVEPNGNFGDGRDEWHDYYVMALAFGGALLAARAMTAVFERGSEPREPSCATAVGASQWWALVGAAVAFYTLNHFGAFFVTGVDAKIVLPGGLNAPLAFMALIGFAVVASTLVSQDLAARGRLESPALLSMLSVAAMASVSMASRAAIVMQAVPMLLGATYWLRSHGRRSGSIRSFLLFAGFLLVVLVVVSIYRIVVFSASSTADSDLVGFFALESAMLAIDRWVGAEAIMVAVSEPARSIALMMQLLGEDPATGTEAIYQVLAGSRYELLRGLTFLTLPGYFGVLGLSGSVAVVFGGTLFVGLAGLLYEKLVARALFAQPVCVALVSAAIANALTQLSFPRLLVPFLFQMTALVLILHLWMSRSSARWTFAPRLPSATATT
jgi:hypothetical protein